MHSIIDFFSLFSSANPILNTIKNARRQAKEMAFFIPPPTINVFIPFVFIFFMKKFVALLTISLFLANSYALDNKIKPSSYKELVSWYMELEEKYPNYVEIFKANEIYGLEKVEGGYDLYYVRITNESNGFHKPEALFLGSPHGDETTGTIGLYYAVKYILENRNEKWIKWLLNHREIYVEISHNPYGFDERQRYDANGWDLNREADYDWKGINSELWGSVNGKTLMKFINTHAIRVGADFHGGVRMLLYPWASTHKEVVAKSPFSNKKYKYAPPDFYFYHVAALRLGEYMGDFGGELNERNIGTIPSTIGYEAPGCIASWAYGGNVKICWAEDEFVNDEVYGNYDGCGIFWISPELSRIKDPAEWKFGNEKTGYIAEVIRFVLHQVDIAQPYIMWVEPQNNSCVAGNLILKWQVYGCLVVDETYIMYSSSRDFKDARMGKLYDNFKGRYMGGTYWDGYVWQDEIEWGDEKELYVVAYAKVDQIYKNVIAPYIYGNSSYLRIIKERTDESYYETIDTIDGIEEIKGHIWWHSPVLHIIKGGIRKPKEGFLYIAGREIAKIGIDAAIIIGGMKVEVEGEYDKVEFYVDDEIKYVDKEMPYEWNISKSIGNHKIKVKMYKGERANEDYIKAVLLIIK